jgi:hypothetical protein
MIIYNKSKDCFLLVPGPVHQSPNNLILVPSDESCSSFNNESNFSNLWQIERYLKLDDSNKHLTLQIKHANQYNFIYCYKHHIDVYGKHLECPNFVFSLPSSLSFSIGKMSYTATQVRLQSDLTFNAEESLKVNVHLNSVTNVSVNLKELNASVEAIDLQLERYNQQHNPQWVILFICCTIGFLAIIGLVCIIREYFCSKPPSQPQNIVVQNRIEDVDLIPLNNQAPPTPRIQEPPIRNNFLSRIINQI